MHKIDYSYRPDFTYRHQNPYHDKLQEFAPFVFRDNEGETYRGKWREEVFHRGGPLHVEIGTGYGEFMHAYCQNHPHINFVGMDYRFKRSFKLAKKLSLLPQQNFRYLRSKGERLSFLFAPQEIDALYFFFPDPWPKVRHHKKRLFQLPFLEGVHQALKTGGLFFVKTDHQGYYHWMCEELKNAPFFHTQLATENLYAHYPQHFLCQYQTKFEKIFLGQQIPIKALVLEAR